VVEENGKIKRFGRSGREKDSTKKERKILHSGEKSKRSVFLTGQ